MRAVCCLDDRIVEASGAISSLRGQSDGLIAHAETIERCDGANEVAIGGARVGPPNGKHWREDRTAGREGR